MNVADFPRFDELLSRHLDDTLTDAGAAELVALLSEPQWAARFLEMTRLNSEIAGLLAAPVPDAVMVELVRTDLGKCLTGTPRASGLRLRVAESAPSRASSSPADPGLRPLSQRTEPVFQMLAWAAVLLVIAGLAAVFLVRGGRPAEAPSVASLQGEVRLIGTAGARALKPGQSWPRGETLKTVGPDSSVTMTFNDGTRLDFRGNSMAVNRSGKEGRRVELEQGAVQGAVKQQPARRAFVFVTPDAEAIVVGTTLQVATDGHHTRLEVTEGEVRFRRRHDGTEVAVKAGHFAVVAPNLPLVVKSIQAEPHHLK